jgi:hypothetical protein
MRASLPRTRRLYGLQLYQPALLVAGVVLLASTIRVLEVHLFQTFKLAHITQNFASEVGFKKISACMALLLL